MTDDNIDQKPIDWQERRKLLLRRIENLGVLIGQARDDVLASPQTLSGRLNNELQTLILKLDSLRQELGYLVNKQDDLEQQESSEPLIIKKEK